MSYQFTAQHAKEEILFCISLCERNDCSPHTNNHCFSWTVCTLGLFCLQYLGFVIWHCAVWCCAIRWILLKYWRFPIHGIRRPSKIPGMDEITLCIALLWSGQTGICQYIQIQRDAEIKKAQSPRSKQVFALWGILIALVSPDSACHWLFQRGTKC